MGGYWSLDETDETRSKTLNVVSTFGAENKLKLARLLDYFQLVRRCVVTTLGEEVAKKVLESRVMCGWGGGGGVYY